jgi:hypothetical protein
MSTSTRNGLLTERKAAERYCVSVRTLSRWDQARDLDFPAPVFIRGRRYRDIEKLDAWDLANAQRAVKENHKRAALEHEERVA